ncbi:MAG: cyanophycinase [Acidobacteria bacterium]|nr:cyanophycinase [Acidobacteriota bacterium]
MRNPVNHLHSVVTLVILAALVSAEEPPVSKGHLVLIGGGEKPAVAMQKFVELAGGPNAAILIVPTASEQPDTGTYYEQIFEHDYECTNVTPLALSGREDAQRASIVKLINGAGGIFFAGGDQSRVTAALLDTPAFEAMGEAFARGAVLGGTSAGAACMSPLMITGEGNFNVLAAATVDLQPGLGFFPGAILDQHFIARQRENRLIAVVLEHPDLLGVGIDEATAVWLRPDHTFQVLGSGWVAVLDAIGASVRRQPVPDGEAHLGVLGLRVDILLPGDVYDLGSRSIVGPGGRVPQPGAPAEAGRMRNE